MQIFSGGGGNRQVFTQSGTFTAKESGLHFISLCGGGGNAWLNSGVIELFGGGGAGALIRQPLGLEKGVDYAVTIGGVSGSSKFSLGSHDLLVCTGGVTASRYNGGSGGVGHDGQVATGNCTGEADGHDASADFNAYCGGSGGHNRSDQVRYGGRVRGMSKTIDLNLTMYYKCGGGRCALSPYGEGQSGAVTGLSTGGEPANTEYSSTGLGLLTIEW